MSFVPTPDHFQLGSDSEPDEEPSVLNKGQIPTSPKPDVNKPQPRPSLDEEAAPLRLAALRSANLFLPIPNTDPLNVLLTKYVPPEARPPRDTSGTWTNEDVHTLIVRCISCSISLVVI